MRQIPFRSEQLIIRIGFALALSMLAMIAVTAYLSITGFVERVALVERTQQTFIANQDVLTLVKDAVIAQRGYVITGEARYLVPRDIAAAALHDKVQALKALAGPQNPENLPRLDELESISDGILVIISKSIELKRQGVPAEATEQVLLIDQGKRDLDRARALVAEIRTASSKTMLESLHESQATGENTTRALIVTELASFAILLLAFGFLTRQVLLRSRAEAALKRANDDLEGRIAGRTAELAQANTQLERKVVEHQHARTEITALNLTLESRVSQRTAQLEEANQQMESFGYSVSHDLRAPLRAIMGYARILDADHGHRLDAEGMDLLRVISDNSRKMGQLIDDLLAFSRMSRQPFVVGPVNMGELARDAVRDLQAASPDAPMRIEVKSMPGLMGDSHLLRLVWVNLLANAVKFAARNPAALVEAGGCVSGDESVFYVRDNGVGFDMRYYDKLFGVFERLHSAEEFPGTGVGLATVRRVVMRHGGRVWAEGQVGQGATFHFALPRVDHDVRR